MRFPEGTYVTRCSSRDGLRVQWFRADVKGDNDDEMGTVRSPDGGVAVCRDGHGRVSGSVGRGSWVRRPPRLQPLPVPGKQWKQLLPSRTWSRPWCSVRLLRLPAIPLSGAPLRFVSSLLWRLLCLRRLWPVPGVRASARLLLFLLRWRGEPAIPLPPSIGPAPAYALARSVAHA